MSQDLCHSDSINVRRPAGHAVFHPLKNTRSASLFVVWIPGNARKTSPFIPAFAENTVFAIGRRREVMSSVDIHSEVIQLSDAPKRMPVHFVVACPRGVELGLLALLALRSCRSVPQAWQLAFCNVVRGHQEHLHAIARFAAPLPAWPTTVLLAGDNVHTLIRNHGDLGGTELEVLLGHLDWKAP
jgi:hypothetical protein